MNNDLYFLRLIGAAFQEPDLKTALREAFKKIRSLGKQPEYQQGFLQFQRFMAEMQEGIKAIPKSPGGPMPVELLDLTLQLAADSFEGSQAEAEALQDLVKSSPVWKEGFETLREEVSKSEASDWELMAVIERNGETISSFPLLNPPFTKKIRNLRPGHYVLRLNTGRVLWQEELTERDLIWAAAFPGRDLDLAADTGGLAPPMSREFRLLDGDLIIRVFPGIDSGRLEVERTLKP